MRRIILLAFVIFLSQAVLGVENYNNMNKLEISVDVNLNFSLQNLDKYKMNDLTADLFLVPENNYRQGIKSFELNMNPTGKKTEKAGYMRYEWRSSKGETAVANMGAIVVTKNAFFNIDKKVKYPVAFNGNLEYLGESKYIDINEDIRNMAKGFVDTDDLFALSVKVGEWVRRNIKYNLSTLNSETVFKSSEVLEKGEGVCDEITNLFISLMRSLGVPARFVTGVVYTNAGYKWSSHGWAEIYFPEYGWVPFDVTFGQYGWIDPSHVKLQHSAGSGEASVNYRWHSAGGKAKLDKIELNAYYLSSISDGFKSPVKINGRAIADKAGFGSYVPVAVEVENLESSYLSTQIYLSNVPGVYGEREKVIALGPKEKKNVVFIINFDENLNNEYIYSTDVKVNSQFGDSFDLTVRASKDYKVYSLDDALNFLKEAERRGKKKDFELLNFDCKGDKESYLGNETGKIKCLITSNESYERVNVCLAGICKNVSINKELTLDFNVNFKGNNELMITAENEEFFRNEYLKIKVNKMPIVEIADFNLGDADYSRIQTANITLNSNTEISNLTFFVNDHDLGRIPEMEGIEAINVSLNGGMLYSGSADVKIIFNGADGNEYKINEVFKVNILNVPLYLRAVGFFKNLL